MQVINTSNVTNQELASSHLDKLDSNQSHFKNLSPSLISIKPITKKNVVIDLRNIERIYGCKGPEMVEALYLYPKMTIPILINRLTQKNQEWINLSSQLE